ncbi:hypothetical protein [Clostridioides difficile]|uniref:hypothetical protein n=1 Tax=Clostridioides difficile TaxID=1496 RepID=UPI000D1DB1E8|nr:hypothetical protein [Clostridioides difficile]HBE9444597.1 hypothetical protein [Clostridioides difficile]
MKKVLLGIFLIIAVLVVAAKGFNFGFGKNGLLETGINSVGGTVNSVWQKIAGSSNGKIVNEYKGEDNTGLDDATSGW